MTSPLGWKGKQAAIRAVIERITPLGWDVDGAAPGGQHAAAHEDGDPSLPDTRALATGKEGGPPSLNQNLFDFGLGGAEVEVCLLEEDNVVLQAQPELRRRGRFFRVGSDSADIVAPDTEEGS